MSSLTYEMGPDTRGPRPTKFCWGVKTSSAGARMYDEAMTSQVPAVWSTEARAQAWANRYNADKRNAMSTAYVVRLAFDFDGDLSGDP